MWISIPHSTFQCTLARWGMRHSQFFFPHSTFQNSGMELECGFPFHIPHSNHDSNALLIVGWGMRHYIKEKNSTFHIPEFWNGIGMWISIPHSKFRIPNPWNLNWNRNWEFIYIPNSIPFLFHRGCHKLVYNVVQFQVPFQFHIGWNGMWNLGLILGVAWSFSLNWVRKWPYLCLKPEPGAARFGTCLIFPCPGPNPGS